MFTWSESTILSGTLLYRVTLSGIVSSICPNGPTGILIRSGSQNKWSWSPFRLGRIDGGKLLITAKHTKVSLIDHHFYWGFSNLSRVFSQFGSNEILFSILKMLLQHKEFVNVSVRLNYISRIKTLNAIIPQECSSASPTLVSMFVHWYIIR